MEILTFTTEPQWTLLGWCCHSLFLLDYMYYIILLINVISSQNKYTLRVSLDDAWSSPQDFIKRCWQKSRIRLTNDMGEKQFQHAKMPPVYMQT